MLAFSGVGQYLLLLGLALCVVGGGLIRGWRGAMFALLFAVVLGIVLLVATNATAATWRELRGSDSPAAQTPSPKKE